MGNVKKNGDDDSVCVGEKGVKNGKEVGYLGSIFWCVFGLVLG